MTVQEYAQSLGYEFADLIGYSRKIALYHLISTDNLCLNKDFKHWQEPDCENEKFLLLRNRRAKVISFSGREYHNAEKRINLIKHKPEKYGDVERLTRIYYKLQ